MYTKWLALISVIIAPERLYIQRASMGLSARSAVATIP
jgi:hypothetical protein